MKNKINLNSIATRNLKTRRRQYFSMIISIIFAMIFSSGILFFSSSLIETSNEYYHQNYGKQSAILSDNENNLEKALTNSDYGAFVKSYGYAKILSQAVDENNNSWAMAVLSDDAKEIAYQISLSGQYPQNSDEIAIEKSTLSSLGYDETYLNKTITLSINIQNGNDVFENTVEKEYTLVGIYKDHVSHAVSHFDNDIKSVMPSIFLSDDSVVEAGGKAKTIAYVVSDTSDKVMEAYYLIDVETKFDFDESFIWQWLENQTANFSYPIAVAAILLLASCLAIISTFNALLDEHKKQIGILKTVGATKKQLIKIYSKEALIISLISAPISLVVSFFLTKLILPKIYGDAVVKLSIRVLFLCAIFGIVCVFLASIIPLVRAANISPLHSIKNVEINRRVKTKKIKSQENFDTSKLIAKRALVLGNTKRVIVSLIIILTIVVSSVGFAVCDSMSDDVGELGYDYTAHMSFYSDSFLTYSINLERSFTNSDISEIKSNQYVESVNAFGEYTTGVICLNEKNEFLEALNYRNTYELDEFGNLDKDNLVECEELKSAKSTLNSSYVYKSAVCSISQDTIDILGDLLNEGSLDKNKFKNGEEVVLVVPKNYYVYLCELTSTNSNYLKEVNFEIEADSDEMITLLTSATCCYSVGDTIDLSVLLSNSGEENSSLLEDSTFEKISKSVKVAGIIYYEEGDNADLLGDNGIYVSSDEFNILTTSTLFSDYGYEMGYSLFNLDLNCECTDEINTEITELIESISTYKNMTYITSVYELNQESAQTADRTQVCIIGILIIFVAVSASIINNSIGSQIRNNKRQFGTLRAVGANQKVIVKSFVIQLLSIFSWSYLIGFAVSILAWGAINLYYKVAYSVDSATFSLKLIPSIIIALVLLAICSLNLYFKVKKKMKNSIIENIREIE